jgi:hypothetical protein
LGLSRTLVRDSAGVKRPVSKKWFGDYPEAMPESQPPPDSAAEFAREADLPSPSLVREFWDFLRTNKKWWLGPIILILLLASLLAIAAGSPAAPFVYTLF